MSLADSINELLSMLPFNGNKTLIGTAVSTLVPVAVSIFPPLAIAAPWISGISAFFAAVGLFHKTVK